LPVNITGSLNTPKLFNSSGTLKIQPDVQGDVELFSDTDVPDNESGKIFKVWRKAAEGNDYIRFYISSGRNAFIHASNKLTLQAQVPFTINSVTDDIIFKVGDNAGAKKFYFKDSDGADLVTIDSNGQLIIDANMGGIMKVVRGSNNSIETFMDSTYTDLRFGGAKEYNRIGTWIDKPFQIVTNSLPRVTIDNAGNVGIGTTEPQLPLDVRNDDDNLAIFVDTTAQAEGVGGGIAFGGKYTDVGDIAMSGRIGTQKTNSTSGHVGFDIVLETQDSIGSITERIKFTSDAKCGINLEGIAPTKELDVGGDGRIRGDLTIDDNISPLTFAGATGIKLDFYNNATYAIGVESSELRIASNAAITFCTDGYSGTPDVVITDEGYMGIGTDDPQEELHIKSDHPRIMFEEADAPSNEKVWEFAAGAEEFSLRTANDLYTGYSTVLKAKNRGGTSVGLVCIPNANFSIGTSKNDRITKK